METDEKMEEMVFWVDDWDLVGQYEPMINPEEVLDGIETFKVGNMSMQTILDNIETSAKDQRCSKRWTAPISNGCTEER